jgi:hypothetical protein
LPDIVGFPTVARAALDDLPAAHHRVLAGQGRGEVVVLLDQQYRDPAPGQQRPDSRISLMEG